MFYKVCILVILTVYSAEAHWYAKWFDEIPLKQLIPMDVLSFHLIKTQENYFKVLEVNSTWMIVGGRNAVYNVSLTDMKENNSSRLQWEPELKEKEFCIIRGRSDEDCQNYIGVRVEIDQNRTLICGTNAYQPFCRIHGTNSDIFLKARGVAISPHDPRDQSTVIFSDGKLYTGTGSDFLGKDRTINRFNLVQGVWQERTRTGKKMDKDHLNQDATFIGSLDIDEHIYFFFRESANEKEGCRNMASSRVGRVCKKDTGDNPNIWQYAYQLWTSFEKARFNCSIGGDNPFYFDEIQSISHVVKGIYGNKEERVVYAVFSSTRNSLPASAVCAFRVDDIKAAFNGSYQEEVSRRNDKTFSAPTFRHICGKDSFTIGQANLEFFTSHSLMYEYVQPFYSQPVVTHASLSYRFTKLVVDPQVPTSNNQSYDVLIIATDRGTVIRAVNVEAYSASSRVTPIVIEEMRVFDNGEVITDLKLVPRTKKRGQRRRLIVVSKNEIRNVPLGRCSDTSGCAECLALHDPYCAWNPSTWRCVAYDSSKRNLIQAITDGYSNLCPDNGAKRPAASALIDDQYGDPNDGCYCTLDPTASKCISFNSTESIAMYNIMKSIAVVNYGKNRSYGKDRNEATRCQSITTINLLVFYAFLNFLNQ